MCFYLCVACLWGTLLYSSGNQRLQVLELTKATKLLEYKEIKSVQLTTAEYLNDTFCGICSHVWGTEYILVKCIIERCFDLVSTFK